ncbi:FG-GAP repeat domain-containing protein [Rhodovulum kholense]|uniref:VCBS repeat protein n=1 Tax=Rhodovulum kholense TaxID=453584 RepID=A0A8E3ASQ8_9RHOB|nr:VCBS repeat-containing protein [Rhodovulum kholense]PTW51336.1 VCBS repeat protein [Rhodovulum kholense]
MRGAALLAAAFLLAGAVPVSARDGASARIAAARYADPTARYDHGVLGDGLEWGSLVLRLSAGGTRRIVLPDTRVFEDLAPRLADLDGDGAPEVLAVETDLSRGARLSVYGADGLIAATPFIGQPYRWLAPAGAADLDGDGRVEIAYIDRPHRARVLRIWRLEAGRLVPVAVAEGLTNHRIGKDVISGGLRTCGVTPELLLADPDWQRVIAVRLSGGQVSRRALPHPPSPAGFAAAAACR